MHIRTGNIEYSYEISRKILKKIKRVFYRSISRYDYVSALVMAVSFISAYLKHHRFLLLFYEGNEKNYNKQTYTRSMIFLLINQISYNYTSCEVEIEIRNLTQL